MRRAPDMVRRQRDWWTLDRLKIVLLASAVFVLDTATTVDVPVLYVNVVLLAMRSGRTGDVVAAGWGSAALTLINLGIDIATRRIVVPEILNSSLSIVAIFCVMVICLRSMRSQVEIQRARDTIAFVSRLTSLKTISASVVHEVTQPLAAIGANASAADRWLSLAPPNLDEAKAANRRVVAAVERASHIIDRLRRLMTLGHISLKTCNVARLIEEALEHLRLDIEDVGVHVTSACPHALSVKADAVLIGQVVINAVSNAIDALREVDAGSRSIAIEAGAAEGRVRVAITDTGPGAEAGAIEHIFEPFFTTKTGKGMGMGLAVSRSIVEAHGGTIRAVPNVPRGLVVEFTLPDPMPKPR